MIQFRGQRDGKAIIPDEPLDIADDRRAWVTVEDAEESASQGIARLAKDLPGNSPSDLAAWHDHYTHGRPRR